MGAGMTTALELAEELVTRFDLTQLRHELHVAEINIRMDSDECSYWCWYKLAVEEAIDLVKLATPRPLPRPGYVDIETLRSRANIVALAAFP